MGTRLYSREMRAAIAITICLLALVSALPVEEQPEQTSRDPVLAMMQDAIDSEATSSEATLEGTLEATHEKAKWGKAKWVHALTRAPAHGGGRRRATKTPSRPTKPKPTSKPSPDARESRATRKTSSAAHCARAASSCARSSRRQKSRARRQAARMVRLDASI